ncbi:MAG: gas vesicle structural protein [Phycisphaerales bacterium]|nr:gas vesicle structural protein [Phycisphaerales bacterium]
MVAQSGYGNSVADDLASDPMVRRDPSLTRDLAPASRRDSQVRRAPSSSGLYDVLDLILDKGIVIDAFVRVSLVGIELLTVDLRVVIASVDTYLRYAEGAERLQIYDRAGSKRLPDVVGGGMKKEALDKGAKSVGRALGGGKDDEDEEDDDRGEKHRGITGTLTRGMRNVVGSLVGGGDDDDEEEDKGERPSKRRHAREGDRRNGGSSKSAGARR